MTDEEIKGKVKELVGLLGDAELIGPDYALVSSSHGETEGEGV